MYFVFQCEVVKKIAHQNKGTRTKSSSHMSKFVGNRQELLVSELPNVRDILRYSVFLREQSEDDRRNYQVDKLVGDIPDISVGQSQYSVHTIFINEKITIISKFKEFWDQAVNFSLGKGIGDAKERFVTTLDKLFDILNCKYQITSCEDEDYEYCIIQAHINCSCSRDKKIPVKDLAYIKRQREKVESKGSHQMRGPDQPEHKRQVRSLERQRKGELARRKILQLQRRQSGRLLQDF